MSQTNLLILIIAISSVPITCSGQTVVQAVDHPDTSVRAARYVSNRRPLAPSPLIKLPAHCIRPEGWLRKQLELQAAGFHGHLGEISKCLRKPGNAWLEPSGKGAHGWEEPPYWLKGYLNLANILGDEKMIAESNVWIEGALSSQQPDGWFGPGEGRGGAATKLTGRDDLWPNMIMLFCLQDHYESTSDDRVIRLMTNYFKYLSTLPEEKFLVGYWPKMRGGDLLMSVYWLYNRTGDEWLLELAKKVHRNTAAWEKGIINWHNVNIAQAFGQPATFFMQSHDPKHSEAAYRNYGKIRELYGQVPGGMFGGDERCRPGYIGPRQAVETCGIVEMMLSTETLTWITGDLLWADRCEDVAFNSFPAALTADMKALRYLTAPNHVLSDSRSKKPGLHNDGPMYLMNPHGHRCCQHNWGHGWPYFAGHLWFATPDGGLAAVLYCDSRVTAKVADGTEVSIDQNTHYPFDESVELVVQAGDRPVRFPLYLRVPGWCRKPMVQINGQAVDVDAKPGQYIVIDRTWKNGDAVSLVLPMEVTLRTWAKNHHSISVDRGPLTYSLKIGEKYVRHGGTDSWPAWEIHPTTAWNYGLVFDGNRPIASLKVVKKAWPKNDLPFTHDGTPIKIKAQGKRIPNWRLDHLGLVGKLQPSPVDSDEPTETIDLIPMGAARLRISAFPVIGDGPNAHSWIPVKTAGPKTGTTGSRLSR